MVGETEFTVPTEGGSFEWKGHGLRLHVPEDSLPADMGKCRINIRASLSVQFQFPEDSDLLSPVFWISTPCKFAEPVTLEIQHCAFQEDDATLSFPRQGGSLEWKGYGLKLHNPERSIPLEVEEFRINIKASLFGQFQFSEDSDLLP